MSPEKVRVLLVEDNDGDARLIRESLSESQSVRFALSRAARLDEALDKLKDEPFDAVLLDLSLPDAHGLDTLRRVRAAHASVPIVIMTGLDAEETGLQAVKEGAQEYLVKGEPASMALARTVRHAIERKHIDSALRASMLQTAETGRMLSDSEANYRHLFNAVADPIFILDLDTRRIEDVNAAAESLYGYARAELIGMDAIILTDEPEATNSTLERMKNESSELTQVRRHRRKDGGVFPTEIHYSVFARRSRRTLVAVVRDISGRVEAQRQIEKAETQLRQAQKMEAVGRLAGGVAHDFNNLLTAIGGYSEFLLNSLSPGDARRDDVEQIIKAAERATSLTRQLLAFSRQQTLQTKILDCRVVVADLQRILQRVVGEDVKLVTALAPETGCIKADPGQIDQVLLNLVVNAKDAMPKGGKITIETGNVDVDDEYARMHLQTKAGPYVVFTVTDTGTGMDANAKAHLFEPFFTTKEQGKGTGLGLATVYGIVKQSGGGIYVYSEKGIGTTFKVYFQRVEGAADAVPMNPKPHKSFSGSETVLLVEDDELVRAFVQRTLLQQGYAVLVAQGPGEALILCEQNKNPIHLVLTDVVMPQMHGPDMVKRVSALHPESKVMYMSGYTDTTVAHPGLIDSGVPILQKPLSTDVLKRALREVLDRPL
jgi:PAS domain S-box-containing protein